jgi:hypothetical protein
METLRQGFWKSFSERVMGGVTRHEKKKCAMHCHKGTSGFFAWIGRLEEPEFKLLHNTRLAWVDAYKRIQ